jgi:hypothetical protein
MVVVLPTPFGADHQNHKRRFAFYVQRLIHFARISPIFFQQAVQRFGAPAAYGWRRWSD